jgi:hypothetical protein
VFHGACNEPKSLADMRRADARRREIDRPAGVTNSFQVRLNKVEPSVAHRIANLFTKDCCRAALADEMEPSRP